MMIAERASRVHGQAQRAGPVFARARPWIVGVACGYEMAALLTGRVPTISDLQYRFRPLGVAVVAWICVHFWLEDPAPKVAPRP